MSPARVPQAPYSFAPDAVMERRAFMGVITGGLVAAPLAIQAQQPEKVYRIGMLERTSPAINAANLNGFRQGLRELGYVEGKTFIIESALRRRADQVIE